MHSTQITNSHAQYSYFLILNKKKLLKLNSSMAGHFNVIYHTNKNANTYGARVTENENIIQQLNH